jgi:hypothetical protein
MTQQNLIIDGANGRVALYSGPQSDAIEADPFTDLSKVTFHSDLDYIGFTKITKTYTIPATSGGVFRMERIDLGAHGKAFTPICFAVLRGWNNGDGNPVDLPLAGGVLLDFYGERPDDSGTFEYEQSIQSSNIDRWQRTGNPTRSTYFDDAWDQKSLLVGAGADGSNLFLWYEQAVWPQGGDGASYPALALTIDFFVGDRSIDGSSGEAAPSALFEDDATTGVVMSSTRLTASGTTDGGFDSDRYYFHADDTDPLFPVATSNAVEFSSGGTSPNIYTRDAFYYGPDWSFDIRLKSGSPTIPAAPVPTIKGLSV